MLLSEQWRAEAAAGDAAIDAAMAGYKAAVAAAARRRNALLGAFNSILPNAGEACTDDHQRVAPLRGAAPASPDADVHAALPVGVGARVGDDLHLPVLLAHRLGAAVGSEGA